MAELPCSSRKKQLIDALEVLNMLTLVVNGASSELLFLELHIWVAHNGGVSSPVSG